MRQLRIVYRSFGVRREVIRQVPQKWEELTPDQFLLVSRFYLQEMDESSFLKGFYSLPSGVGFDSYYIYRLSELLEFHQRLSCPDGPFYPSLCSQTESAG